jgi:hypothetical protein
MSFLSFSAVDREIPPPYKPPIAEAAGPKRPQELQQAFEITKQFEVSKSVLK